jgi:hypothetical protein
MFILQKKRSSDDARSKDAWEKVVVGDAFLGRGQTVAHDCRPFRTNSRYRIEMFNTI